MPRRLDGLRDGRKNYRPYFWGVRPCGEEDTPAHAVKSFLLSFATQDTLRLRSLITQDYRFFSDDPVFQKRYPSGLDADGQIDSICRIPPTPPGVSSSGTLFLRAEFPDTDVVADRPPLASTQAYVPIRKMEFGIFAEQAHINLSRDSSFVFVLVRGNVARLAPGAAADPNRWFVSAWHSAALDSEAFSVVATKAEPQFGIFLASRPHAWPLEFSVSLPDGSPARIEIFDIASRRILSRSLPARAGQQSVVFDRPILPSGVYWARLQQRALRTTTKFVLLR